MENKPIVFPPLNLQSASHRSFRVACFPQFVSGLVPPLVSVVCLSPLVILPLVQEAASVRVCLRVFPEALEFGHSGLDFWVSGFAVPCSRTFGGAPDLVARKFLSFKAPWKSHPEHLAVSPLHPSLKSESLNLQLWSGTLACTTPGCCRQEPNAKRMRHQPVPNLLAKSIRLS